MFSFNETYSCILVLFKQDILILFCYPMRSVHEAPVLVDGCLLKSWMRHRCQCFGIQTSSIIITRYVKYGNDTSINFLAKKSDRWDIDHFKFRFRITFTVPCLLFRVACIMFPYAVHVPCNLFKIFSPINLYFVPVYIIYVLHLWSCIWENGYIWYPCIYTLT